MRTLIRKLFPPIIFSVLFLFAPLDQYATETPEYAILFSHSGEYLNSESIANGHVILTSSVSTEEPPPANTADRQAEVLLRWDIYEIIFGTLLSLIGLALIALSLLRLKEFIMSNAQLPAGQFADALVRQLFNWSGKPSEEALDDDLTLIVADYQHA